ncbi:hypothetical protein HanXRQr2_Chr04g0183771 [Helianthus annuus]|uniref:Uncharacterized protein n=1 Tax=Helianthus annuus TaxID=4232 RepID=A0A9K3JC46_HELAN|nr:hypothetical protein HanXRQr2_Chr04g0183771 [Helianthus annuus]
MFLAPVWVASPVRLSHRVRLRVVTVETRRLDHSRKWVEQTEGRHSSKPRKLKSSGPCLEGCTGFAVGLCSGLRV